MYDRENKELQAKSTGPKSKSPGTQNVATGGAAMLWGRLRLKTARTTLLLLLLTGTFCSAKVVPDEEGQGLTNQSVT